jgi:predicted transcriptional regulator
MPMFRTSTAQLTKAEKLLDILRDHDWHSTAELARRVGHRFGGVVYQLRQAGYIINRERHPTQPFQHRYRFSNIVQYKNNPRAEMSQYKMVIR